MLVITWPEQKYYYTHHTPALSHFYIHKGNYQAIVLCPTLYTSHDISIQWWLIDPGGGGEKQTRLLPGIVLRLFSHVAPCSKNPPIIMPSNGANLRLYQLSPGFVWLQNIIKFKTQSAKRHLVLGKTVFEKNIHSPSLPICVTHITLWAVLICFQAASSPQITDIPYKNHRSHFTLSRLSIWVKISLIL